jgi:hypothetical protein
MRGFVVFPALLAIASGLWAMIAAYRIGSWLSSHGVKVNWFWYRATMPWYVHRYRKMTTESDGKAGFLWVQFIVTVNLALAFAIVTLVALAVGKK